MCTLFFIKLILKEFKAFKKKYKVSFFKASSGFYGKTNYHRNLQELQTFPYLNIFLTAVVHEIPVNASRKTHLIYTLRPKSTTIITMQCSKNIGENPIINETINGHTYLSQRQFSGILIVKLILLDRLYLLCVSLYCKCVNYNGPSLESQYV